MFSKKLFVFVLFSVNTALMLANDHHEQDYIDAKSAGRYRYFHKDNVRRKWQHNATRKQRSQSKIIVQHVHAHLGHMPSIASKPALH